MPKALIVGGRGQCGLAIGEALIDDGWEVTATTSGPVPAGASARTTWITTGETPLGATAGGVDVLVHTTAYTRADADALVALGDRIGSAIVLSTISVYTDDAGRELDTATDVDTFPDWPVPIPEDWPLLAPGDHGYSAQKAAVEGVLRERAPWPVSIIRPGAIHGPHSRHLREWYFIKRVLDHREVVVLPFDVASIFQPTATVNLAELVRLAARRPGSRVLNCGDLGAPTVAEISNVVDGLMGARTRRVLVPGAEPGPTVGNHPWAVPKPVVVDMGPAVAELGYRQPVSYPDALATTIPWAVEACAGRDWREIFPTLANYPDLFDYAAEDAYLAGDRPGGDAP
jgi:nucleoside-diphosphate-sugar epimerase